MKDFLSDNGKTIRKIYVNQFGAIVFALMMALATIKIKNTVVDILSCIVTILFFSYLLYLVAWDKGANDRLKVDGGRAAPCEHKGFRIGLCAMFPVMVLCALWVVFHFLGEYAGIPFFRTLNDILAVIVSILQATFLQTVNLIGVGMPKIVLPVLYLVSALVVAGITWISYYLGYHGKFMSVAYKKETR